MTYERAIDILTPGKTRFSPEEYEKALQMARAALAEQAAPVLWCEDCKHFECGCMDGSGICKVTDTETYYGKTVKNCSHFERTEAVNNGP